MLPSCHGSFWVGDDLSQCFQRNYLQVTFPLAACGISLLLIILSLSRSYAQSRRKFGYASIPAEAVEATPNEHDDEDAESDLMLHKATSRATDAAAVKVDRPRGEVVLVTVEILALLGEVGVSVGVLATHAWGQRYGTIPAIAKLISWAYILFLAAIRLVVSASDRQIPPKLWNHTAFLYSLQWVFTVFVFRSELIYPISKRAMYFSIAEFSLSTLLLLIALTTRRGNRPVVLSYEDDLEPPREPLASLFSLATYSWLDPLVWKGYWKTLELPDVWNLTVKHQAATVLMDFRHVRKTSGLAWRLLRYFDRDLLIQGAWTIFSNCFTFVPTLLLKAILEYIEDPRSSSLNAAWLYVVLLFVSGAVQGVADGQALWIGRKLSVKLRAIIIGEIYAKALRRKAGAKVSATKKKPAEEESQKQKKGFFSFGRKKKAEPKKDQDTEDEKDDESQANVGTIINLMAIDSFKVSEVSAYLHFLWASVPVQVIIAIVLLYKILGFSSFAGIGLMVAILPANVFIARAFRNIQNKILKGTDARIHSTNEVLQNIRIIKYFAWEQRFQNIVDEKRRVELNYLRRRYILWSLAATVWYGTPILITFASFFLYTVVEGKKLVPSIAFPALSMFSLLRVPLDQLADMVAHVQESKVSIDRVEEFLSEEETEKYSQLRDTDREGDEPKIALENATLSWGSTKESDPTGTGTDITEAFRLINVDVDFKIGKLNVIAGPTGSGKTSLLMALLGEMKLVQGAVYLPGGTTDRAELRMDPETSLTEGVAYCAQEAWLVNDTLKENILFATPYDAQRYKAVIHACALERDLQILDAGDQTLVGEKGISLSGGQKQRISLARAMYSRARHLLLDDCLSAVDSHTAKHIFQEAISGPLMMNRTCILVTHNVSLIVPYSDYVVAMDNGRVSSQGEPEEIISSGALGEEMQKSRPVSRGGSQISSRVTSDLEERRREWTENQERATNGGADEIANGASNGAANGSAPKEPSKEKSGTVLSESKASGSVKWPTIKMYLQAMGSWPFWIIAVAIFGAQQIGSVATNIWIREWANAYHVDKVTSSAGHYASVSNFKLPSFASGSVPRTSVDTPQLLANEIAEPRDDVNVAYYLSIYALLGLGYILISLIRERVLFWGSLNASWHIHERLLKAIMHAKFKFFDSTPLGQLMNRFSKDVEAIDQEVAPVAIGMLHSLASIILIVILISVITPAFLIAGVFITILYCVLGAFYLNASRDLKRLESVQRSPLYQQFGETLSGIVTIRAYGDGARFITDNHRRINTYNRPYLYLWACNRWLALRVDIAGALVSFFSGAFVILKQDSIDPGAAGLALTYAVTFTENILWVVRLYSENQQNMNSVERIKEYLEVEQESDAIIPDRRPPRNWPTHGVLEFVDYTTRYRPDLEPVLKGVSFKVQASERVGIVGRTGAGKSSLALALFRGLEAEKGKIIIDGIDIGLIGLQDLRENITIVPQDPTLFSGTLRTNLDPFGVHTDEAIFMALRRVHLLGAESGQTSPATRSTASFALASGAESESEPAHLQDNKNIFRNLESPVSESGSNLSQGQRQLLCLARALLKSPRVLMMDEATASIDYNTDAKIQDTLRELRDSTIITIAHRLQTIIDYDKVLVLDHGKVVEFGSPWDLLSVEDGSFRGMCENSGNLDTLIEGARKVRDQKRLVDDS